MKTMKKRIKYSGEWSGSWHQLQTCNKLGHIQNHAKLNSYVASMPAYSITLTLSYCYHGFESLFDWLAGWLVEIHNCLLMFATLFEHLLNLKATQTVRHKSLTWLVPLYLVSKTSVLKVRWYEETCLLYRDDNYVYLTSAVGITVLLQEPKPKYMLQ